MEYEHDHQHVHLIVYHLIFCPKRRRKIFVGPMLDRLQQLIQEVATANKWSVVKLAMHPDHVHVVLRSHPRTLPAEIARVVKGRFSPVLPEEFPVLKRLPSVWTRSTFYSTGHVRSEII